LRIEVAYAAVAGNDTSQPNCSIDLKGHTVNDKESSLDNLLEKLVAHYRMQDPPAGALDRLKRRLKTEGRMLADNDLDWLAAAGTPGDSPPRDPDDDTSS
jgi:hypothetical protein